VNIFCASIDSQLQELNCRFSDDAMKFHILGSALDPRVAHKSFKINDICQLVKEFYMQNFINHEKKNS
jgi:hypothetical protein